MNRNLAQQPGRLQDRGLQGCRQEDHEGRNPHGHLGHYPRAWQLAVETLVGDRSTGTKEGSN
jgi:hypothetical protein